MIVPLATIALIFLIILAVVQSMMVASLDSTIKCGYGYNYSPMQGSCYPIGCYPGQVRNSSGLCITNPCRPGQSFIPATNSCVNGDVTPEPCPSGFTMNTATNRCEPICNEDEEYDPGTNTCIPTELPPCPGDKVRDTSNVCTCPTGTVEINNDKCVAPCAGDLVLDYDTGTCSCPSGTIPDADDETVCVVPSEP